MGKYDYIELICTDLRGTTGINFQYKIKKILERYYKSNKKTFEMPRHYGGDKKNDGYVKEMNVYYQIFAPIQEKNRISLKKEIIKKIEEDLEGLIKILYIEEKWTKKLEKFIFIVNTFDNPLPEDSENEYENIKNSFLKKYKKYNLFFTLEIRNIDYIKSLLEELQNEEIEAIASYLRVKHLNELEINSINLYKIICKLAGEISAKDLNPTNLNEYKRISTIEKISINDLGEKKERINIIISKLETVEKVIQEMANDIDDENKFESIKEYIINLYQKLKKELSGVKLYDKIIIELAEKLINGKDFRIFIEYLIVYIFDKCDIFEKERGNI